MNSLIRVAPDEDSFWTDIPSARRLADFFEISKKAGFARIVRARGAGDETPIIDGDRFVDPAAISSIHDCIAGYILGTSCDGLVVSGGSEVARRRTVESVVDSLYPSELSGHFMVTDAPGFGAAPFSTLRATIEAAYATFGLCRLPRVAETVWASTFPRIQRAVVGFARPDDLVSSLVSCLVSYHAYAETRSITPIWIVYEYQRQDSRSAKLLADVLRSAQLVEPPFTVICVDDPSALNGAAFSSRFSKIRIDAAGNERLAHALASELSRSAIEAFLMIDLAGEILTTELINETAKERGVLEKQFRHDCEHLADLGLVFGERRYHANRDVSTLAANIIDEARVASFSRWLCDYLVFLLREGKIVESPALAALLASNMHPRAVDVSATALRSLFERLGVDSYSSAFETLKTDLDKIHNAREFVSACNIRLNPDVNIERYASQCEETVAESGATRSRAELAAALAERLGRQDSHSLAWAKRAVIDAEAVEPTLEIRANLILGRNLMWRGRVEEAREVFSNALSSAGTLSDSYGRSSAAVHLAISFFLIGNLSRAREVAEHASIVAEDVNHRAVGTHADYLRARIAFELGRYDDAIRVSSETLNRCTGAGREAFVPLYTLLLRASLQAGRIVGLHSRILDFSESPEVAFLDAEYRYFQGLSSDDSVTDLPSSSRDSGDVWGCFFGPIEAQANLVIADRLVPTYHALIETRGNRRFTSGEKISDLVREERLAKYDLYNSFYCYAVARIVEARNGNEVERTTVLSRAVRYMQMRAAKIDDARDRRDFLERNVWNRELTAYARESKLV